jgi:hypothetical protein
MTTITAQFAALIEAKLGAANDAAQIAEQHIRALLEERVIDNGLRGQLEALAKRYSTSAEIQAALRAAHERYGPAPVGEEIVGGYGVAPTIRVSTRDLEAPPMDHFDDARVYLQTVQWTEPEP